MRAASIFSGRRDAQQDMRYDVTSTDAFLINTVLNEVSAPITLLQNWHPEEKK